MTDCIEHTQKVGRQGYGLTTVDGKTQLLHRKVYCEHNNVAFDSICGYVVRHTCDNKRCINPEHLLVGTQYDNMRDKVLRGRCPKGELHSCSKLTDSAVVEIRRRYRFRCPVNGGTALAREYGISPALVSMVVNNKHWILENI